MNFVVKILIILISGIIAALFMVDFWGWSVIAVTLSVTIAGTIIGIGLIIWQELRRQETKYVQTTQELNKLNVFLRSIARSQIQEKIAVLHDYPTQIPDWKNEDTLRYKTNRIISDVRAIQEVRPLLREARCARRTSCNSS